SNLCLVLDVSLEQDQAERPGFAQERALLLQELRPGQPGDECARCHQARLSWPAAAGSRRRRPQSVGLHNTIAAGRLQAAAQPDRLLAAPERPDHGSVVGALVAQISPADRMRLAAQHAGVLRLDAAERRLRVGFALLRGY